ncbi:MAG: hypothetical protein WD851_23645 [Pirellulales bacterium]
MLHETTQRRVCRFAFLVGCVVPTLVVLAFTAHVCLPGYALRWETPLGQLLDCKATVHQARMPRPGIARFKRLVLTDPETDAVWATLEGVVHETHLGRDRVSIARAVVSCSAGVEIGERIDRLLRSVTHREVELAIDELSLMQDGVEWTVPNVRAQLATNDAGRRLQFWSGESQIGLRMLVQRNRRDDPPTTYFTLQTGAEPLPCWALAVWDRFDHLGSQANFQGRIEVISSRDSAKGKLSGRFSQLVNSPTPVEVLELHWGDGDASLPVGPIPTDPVEALLAQLELRDAPQLAPKSVGDVAWELRPMRSWSRAAHAVTPEQRLLK